MKLLGLLPLASLVSVLLIGKSDLLATLAEGRGNELLSFAAIFAAMLTLALFGYEVRGIQRTHNLITEGKHLEEILGIGHGQFHVCVYTEPARHFLRAALTQDTLELERRAISPQPVRWGLASGRW
jgi:hypothetical protein